MTDWFTRHWFFLLYIFTLGDSEILSIFTNECSSRSLPTKQKICRTPTGNIGESVPSTMSQMSNKGMSVAPETPLHSSCPSSTPTQAQTFFLQFHSHAFLKKIPIYLFFISTLCCRFTFPSLRSCQTQSLLSQFISSFTGQILLCIRSSFQHIVWSSYLFLDAIYLSVNIFSWSFSPSLASLYLFEQCPRLGVTSTSSVCLPLQDESLYCIPQL